MTPKPTAGDFQNPAVIYSTPTFLSYCRQIIADIKRLATPPQNVPLGGGIGIHGGTDRILGGIGIDWTAGCIGLYDSDVEEIYDQVKVGTKVIIKIKNPRAIFEKIDGGF